MNLLTRIGIAVGGIGLILTIVFVPFTPSQHHEARLQKMELLNEEEWKEEYGDRERRKAIDDMRQSILETKEAEKEWRMYLFAFISILAISLIVWGIGLNQSSRDNG